MTHRILKLIFLMSLSTFTACTSSDTSAESATNNDVESKPSETTISIATWNVHNFFDGFCDSGACEYGDYEKVLSEEDYYNKIYTTAKSIRNIKADILMLQEIEKESCLQDLLSQQLPQYPYYVFGETGNNASVDVAIISKYPLKNVQTHRKNHTITLPDGQVKWLARELIQATATLDSSEEITLFTTHFISKASDAEGTRRNEEAKIVNQIIHDFETNHEGAKVAFGGDLNDDPDSIALTNLAENDVLINSTSGTPIEEIYTWSRQAAFDHIFHNKELAKFHELTQVICTVKSSYLEGSDHCAVKSTYKITQAE